MREFRFPSPSAAWGFAQQAREQGHRVRLRGAINLFSGLGWLSVLYPAVGALALGFLGWLVETFQLGVPRLEALTAAPTGAVTMLFAALGLAIGGLVGGLLALRPASTVHEAAVVEADGDEEALRGLSSGWGGRQGVESPEGEQPPHPVDHRGPGMAPPQKMTPLRWLSWGISVLTAGVLIGGLAYIWALSALRGPGSDQTSRISYTLKNAQRVPADDPAAIARYVAGLPGTEDIPIDPILAATRAPLVGSERDIGSLIEASRTVVIVARAEPAYALPAAFTAARFRAPVLVADAGGAIEDAQGALRGARGKTVLVAAPSRLVPDGALEPLKQYGQVERVADNDVYRHALLWARGRWGDFGWGLRRGQKDAYANFILANPSDPASAAAVLPIVTAGNGGPLLYTRRDALPSVVEQYLWYFSPDFFGAPADGPFMNVLVVGGPESVSYGVQSRADLALEVQPYRNQVNGLSGMAALGWAWVFLGGAGAVWVLFALPARVPQVGFYPRLYWPLAVLVLGPLGLLAFVASYHGRLVSQGRHMAAFVRPPWARAVSATVMGMGIGMALMLAVMYLLMQNGMPLSEWFSFTPLFWLGGPMGALMWLLMIVPAIVLSSLFFMGPMLAEMAGKPYLAGVRQALPVVTLSMLAASLGMFGITWWWQNWSLPMMAMPDRWLWPAVFWWASAIGFITALVPNYLMVRSGLKQGVM